MSRSRDPALARVPTHWDAAVTHAKDLDGSRCSAGRLPLRPAPVLLLFSGGVDSTLLAALAHVALPPEVRTLQLRLRLGLRLRLPDPDLITGSGSDSIPINTCPSTPALTLTSTQVLFKVWRHPVKRELFNAGADRPGDGLLQWRRFARPDSGARRTVGAVGLRT